MKETKVFVVNSQGEKLVGIETLPDGKGKFSTVVLVHGFGVTKHESGMFDVLAKKLAGVGIASYRFDFVGRGESQGNYSETTLTKLMNDLTAIIEFAKTRQGIDSTQLSILSQSLGSSTTIALHPKVKCIVLMGAGGKPKQRLIESFTARGGYNSNGISTRRNSAGELIKVKLEFWKDFDKYNLMQAIKQIHCPVLFIHGSADDRVPLEDMEELYAVANEPKEKVIIQGANHGFSPHQEEMYEVVVEWLKKTLL